MRIITGDECGLLKETIPELCRPKQPQDTHSNIVVHSTQDGVSRVDANERQSRSRGLADLTFTSPEQNSFAALRVNGSVELWKARQESKESFGTYQVTRVMDNVFEGADTESGRPMALGAIGNRLCASDSLGNLAVVNSDTCSVVATYSPFAKQASSLNYNKGNYVNMHICTAMAVDSIEKRIALSGRERETTLLDMETGNVVWKAKNLKPDPQTLLQHPIWTTALLFMDATTSVGANVLVAGTAYKQVRLYDVRVDSKVRRPISLYQQFEHRITALCQTDANHLVVGDAAGGLHSLDLRSPKKTLGRFVGPSGSIRQVVKHETLPIIATVGLDRMLRTYDSTKRRQLDCIYLKQRMNCLLFCNDDTWSIDDEAKQSVNVEDDDDDIDVEDTVQDYVDSDQESDSGESESSTEDDSEANNEGELVEEQGETSSDEASDSDDEPPPMSASKRRRLQSK